ncbi:MAG: DNA-binding protein [Pseudomonadota bacterium]
MNQNSVIVKLVTFTSSTTPFGNVEGKDVFRKLVDLVGSRPHTKVFGFSLEGIEATDASFPRESVVALAKHYRGERGVFLTDLQDRDLIDNWTYAARAKDQPLAIWGNEGFEIIGPELSLSARTLVEYVYTRGETLASQAAADLDLSVANASTRLKTLATTGYLLRVEEAAESGGIEFKYQAIGASR